MFLGVVKTIVYSLLFFGVDIVLCSRFIGSVSLKMLNVDHLIVNGDVQVFDTQNFNSEIAEL